MLSIRLVHCVKNVQIRSFFWSIFSRIRTEYGETRSISPYSVRMRQKRTRKNSAFGHFPRSGNCRSLKKILEISQDLFELKDGFLRATTAQNAVNSPNLLAKKFCGKAQFLQKFGRFTRNSVETVLFYKISGTRNDLKLRYFTQYILLKVASYHIKNSMTLILSSGINVMIFWINKRKSFMNTITIYSLSRFQNLTIINCKMVGL